MGGQGPLAQPLAQPAVRLAAEVGKRAFFQAVEMLFNGNLKSGAGIFSAQGVCL